MDGSIAMPHTNWTQWIIKKKKDMKLWFEKWRVDP